MMMSEQDPPEEQHGGEPVGRRDAEDPPSALEPPGYHHDQLPSVEEYKASISISSQEQSLSSSYRQQTRRRRARCALLIAIPVLFLAIVLAIGFSVARRNDGSTSSSDNEGSPSPTGGLFGGSTPPTDKRSSRMQKLTNLITKQGWSNSVELNRVGTPQWAAATWIADDDERELKIEIEETSELLQRYSLATVYFALNGANWAYDPNWMTGKDVCDWYTYLNRKGSGDQVQAGITCEGGSIRELVLPNLKSEGFIPPEIGWLTSLQVINLFGGQFSGTLPETMQSLTKMKELILHDNKLEGILPYWLENWEDLKVVNLAYNYFNGDFPVSIMNHTSLTTLNLADNDFNFDISSFARLTTLEALFLEDNNVYGELGEWVADFWPEMEVLDLSDNLLYGSLPVALFEHPKLEVLDLHGNQFDGNLIIPVPEENEGKKSKLNFLALHQNELTGQIPESIRYLSDLVHLDLSNNLFTGLLTGRVYELTQLRYLFLAYNNFSPGNIPEAIGDLTQLQDLSLRQTNRAGGIPSEIANCVNLVLLDLNDNELGGRIPDEIGGNLSELQFLFLKGNLLSGQIPESMSNLVKLDKLIMNSNNVTGTTEPICDPLLPVLDTFIGDCPDPDSSADDNDRVELICPCCTLCCSDLDAGPCFEDDTFYVDVDPIWDYHYTRQEYIFNADDIIFPGDAANAGIDLDYEGVDSFGSVLTPTEVLLDRTGAVDGMPDVDFEEDEDPPEDSLDVDYEDFEDEYGVDEYDDLEDDEEEAYGAYDDLDDVVFGYLDDLDGLDGSVIDPSDLSEIINLGGDDR